MAPTISDSAYAILRVLAAKEEGTDGRPVVGTGEIREIIGKDPHPVLGRDLMGRGWALKWEGMSELDSPIVAKDGIAGVVLTHLGRVAFELGRLERGDDLPEPLGPRVIRTGKARDLEWWDKHMGGSHPAADPDNS